MMSLRSVSLRSWISRRVSKYLYFLNVALFCQMVHFVAVLVLVLFSIGGTLFLLFFTARLKKWHLLRKHFMLHGPLYECYKSAYCYFEVVHLFRALLLIICICLLQSSPVRGCGVVSMCVCVALSIDC